MSVTIIRYPLKVKTSTEYVPNPSASSEGEITFVKRNVERKADPKIEYLIREESDGLLFSFKTVRNKNDIDWSHKFLFTEYAGTVQDIFVTHSYILNDVKIVRAFNLASNNMLKRNIKAVEDLAVARIVFDPACHDLTILLAQDCDQIDSFKNIEASKEVQCGNAYLAMHNEFFAGVLEKFKIKAEMVNELDGFTSSAYNEAQADLNTRFNLQLYGLVKQLLEACKTKKIVVDGILENVDPEIVELLEAADAQSVLNLKPHDKVEQEFTENKKKVRTLQRRFYERTKAWQEKSAD